MYKKVFTISVLFIAILFVTGMGSATDGISGTVGNVPPTVGGFVLETHDYFTVTPTVGCEVDMNAEISDLNSNLDIVDVDFHINKAVNPEFPMEGPYGELVTSATSVNLHAYEDGFSAGAFGFGVTIPAGTPPGIYSAIVVTVDAAGETYDESFDFELFNTAPYYAEDLVFAEVMPGTPASKTLVIINDHGCDDAVVSNIEIISLTVGEVDVSDRLAIDTTGDMFFDENGEVHVPVTLDMLGIMPGEISGLLRVTVEDSGVNEVVMVPDL